MNNPTPLAMNRNLPSAFLRTLFFVMSLLIASIPVIAGLLAETEPPVITDSVSQEPNLTIDSISSPSQDLRELVVTSESVIRKGNLIELFPGKRDRRFAAGAVDVLSNMNLPEVTVDPLTGSVTSSDGELVQMFIDFQPASSLQLREVRPQDIQRIDIIRTPSDPRFQGARIAANFILRKYEYGGYSKVDGTHHIPFFSSRYGLYSKFSYKRMTYDVSGSLGHTRQGDRSGSEERTVYRFGSEDIERNARTTHYRQRTLTPRVSARAVYNASGISVSNLAAFNFSRNSSDMSGLTDYSAIYAAAENEQTARSYGRSAVWDGNYFFLLTRGWSMNVSGSFTWGSNTDDSSYLLTGNAPIVNDISEELLDADGQLTFLKKFRDHSLNLYGAGGWSRNRLDYRSSRETAVHYREGYGQIGAQVSFSFNGFSISPRIRLSLSSEKMSGKLYTSMLPKGFMPFYLQLTQVSSLSGSLEFAMGGADVSLRSPVLVRLNETYAVRGNPELRNYTLYTTRLGYSHYFGPWLTVRADAAFSGQGNILVPVYTAASTPEGNPMMIRDVANGGRTGTSSLTLTLAGKYLGNRLSVSVSGHLLHYSQHGSVHRHEWSPDTWMTASWYIGNFRLNAYFTPQSTSYSPWADTCVAPFWYVGAAYSCSELYVELRLSNPFRSSYVNSRTCFSSPRYEYEETVLSPIRHQCLRLTLSYSIGYGRKVNRQDEVGAVDGSSSIILRK